MIEIMKASAGSGKTFNLARKYITLLFRKNDRYAYRHILAVTFTNKATDEMKGRILKELHVLSTHPEKSPYLKWFIPGLFSPEEMEGTDPRDIVRELPGRPGKEITLDSLKESARDMLCNILHDYSAFSVSTIDRFFQQTLKAFSREIGQFASYQVELDKNALVNESVDRILDSLTENDADLLEWLTDCAVEQVEKGEKYNLDQRLKDMAGRLKSDSHRMLAKELSIREDEVYSKENLSKVRSLCSGIIRDFTEKVNAAAMDISEALERAGVSYADFYRKFPSCLEDYRNCTAYDAIPLPKDSFLERGPEPGKWFAQSKAARLLPLVRGLEENFKDFIALFGDPFRIYNTARILRQQLYELGVAADLYKEFNAILKEKNVLSIDDSNTILKDIIDGSDAPFVYEKVGIRFENFLLDEFQDTSTIQWENFRPLVQNSEGEGHDNLIVGDVKQSIYRWRGSEWNLLDKELPAAFIRKRETTLDKNFRSCRNIVEFNNAFFSYAADIMDRIYGDDAGKSIKEIYSDVCQEVASRSDEKGMVEVTFCPDEEQQGRILDTIRELQRNGAGYGDIAVLVRNNLSGAQVAEFLIADDIPVITDDSLKVKSSKVVRRLVSLLAHVENPANSVGSYLAQSLDIRLPEDFHSLADLCESLARSLRKYDPEAFDGEITYVQSFVDCVLDFSANYGNSLHAFLRHWEESDPNISSPSLCDAVRIMTIHKSKGLDFKFVIFPFAEKVNLFRRQNVWCGISRQGTPFDQIEKAIYDVPLSEDSSHTLFEQDFLTEKKKQFVDNINTFYVALTRAVKGMHIISSMPSRKFLTSLDKGNPEYRNLSNILYAFLDSPEGLAAGFRSDRPENPDTEGIAFRLGEVPHFAQENESVPESTPLPVSYESYPLNPEEGEESVFDQPGRSRLVLSSDYEDFFAEDGRTGADSSNRIRGILLHQILSKVEVPSDLGKAVADAAVAGLISEDEKEEAFRFLSGKIRSVESRGWFPEKGARIINESALIDVDGSIYRPDRVVVREDGSVVIVDYKFGEEEKRYSRQVQRYADLWRKRGHADVSAYLWYVMTDVVR